MDERILALDVGDARLGIAVSDPTRTLAQPVEVLQRKGWGPDTRRIQEFNVLRQPQPLFAFGDTRLIARIRHRTANHRVD